MGELLVLKVLSRENFPQGLPWISVSLMRAHTHSWL